MKDKFQVCFWVVTTIGVLATFAVTLWNTWRAEKTRAGELRAKKAALARDLLDGVRRDEKARRALDIIDSEYWAFRSREPALTRTEAFHALRADDPDLRLTDAEDTIREAFDELAYHLMWMHQHIQARLIVPEDVLPYFQYYAERLADADAVMRYFARYHSDAPCAFLRLLKHTKTPHASGHTRSRSEPKESGPPPR